MSVQPQKFEMILLEGDPNGLRYINLVGGCIQAFVAPRKSIGELLKRDELQQAGVYILYSDDIVETEQPLVYIGQSDMLTNRLREQNRTKDFWIEVIAFIGKGDRLDSTGVRYLEGKFIHRVREDKLVDLSENKQEPQAKIISEGDQIVLDQFFDKMMLLLRMLGYRIVSSEFDRNIRHKPNLEIQSSGVQAKGRDLGKIFRVYEGSEARRELTASTPDSVRKMRESLLNKGVLKEGTDASSLVFDQDYEFTSPSMAASIVLGRSANGRDEWKNSKGKSLKDLQSE
jgi:hypothetical protein